MWRLFCTSAVAAFFVTHAALGVNYTYNAPGNVDWNDMAAWAPAGSAITLADTATIPGGAADIVINTEFPGLQVGNITIGTNAARTGMITVGAYAGTTGSLEIASGATIIKNQALSDRISSKLQLDGPTTFCCTDGILATYGINGQGGVIKDGIGDMKFEAFANTYSGQTWVKAGKLLLSGEDGILEIGAGGLKITFGRLQYNGSGNHIADDAPVELSGGSQLNFAGYSETMGVLTLSGNATGFGGDHTTGGDIHFANSSAATWVPGAVLTLTTFESSAVPTYYFGSDTTGLTANQLAQIRFVDGVTGAISPAGWDPAGNGLLVPVPEPMTISLLVVGGLAMLKRRK